MLKYRKYITIIFTLIMLLPLLSGVLAVGQVVQYPVAEIIKSEPVAAYPGDTITVYVKVYEAGLYRIVLQDLYTGDIYNSIELYLYPGDYMFYLSLPAEMPGTIVIPYIYIGPNPYWPSPNETVIYPKLVITPSTVSNIDPYGNPRSVIVKGTGFEPGSVIDTIYADCEVAACATLSKYWSITPITVDETGTFEVELYFDDLSPDPWLARGRYKVYTYDFRDFEGNGTLVIIPQITLDPLEGFGDWREKTTVKGYGFSAKAQIKEIKFQNTDFPEIAYIFKPKDLYTDESGTFTYNIAFQRNMTAGLYKITVIEAPIVEEIRKTATFTINASNTIEFLTIDTEPVFGIPVYVNVTAYIEGTDLVFVTVATNWSFIKEQVLSIDFTYLDKWYRLSAAAFYDAAAGVMKTTYELLNMTGYPEVPPRTLFVITVNMTYDPEIGANVSTIYFTPGLAPSLTDAPEYKFSATFYEYVNQIFLVLKRKTREIFKAVAYVYYKNYETATELSFEGNMTVGIEYMTYTTGWFEDGPWRWRVGLTVAVDTLDAEAVLEGYVVREDVFESPGYLVRPRLSVVGGVPLPGAEVTILATGYGPGEYYTGVPNILTLVLDNGTWPVVIVDAITDIIADDKVELGKDGNTTFTIKLPDEIPFGAHWLWGYDSFGYEYTLMLLVGAKTFYAVIVYGVISPLSEVSAAPETEIVDGIYKGIKLEVCPCEEITVTKVCEITVTTAIPCEYLGDEVEVRGSGFTPGTVVTILLRPGNIPVARTTVTDDGSFVASFIVPTIPAGEYQVIIKTPTEEYVAQFFNGTHFLDYLLVVKPKVVLTMLSDETLLPILNGPGLVRVIGTGFVPGTAITGIVVNGTEVLYTLNTHITGWRVNLDGVLESGVEGITPALYIPFADEGVYEVALVYKEPGAPEAKVSTPGYVVVVNKIVHDILIGIGRVRDLSEIILSQVTGNADLLGAIKSDTEVIKGTLETAVGLLAKLDTIEASVAGIDAKLGKLDVIDAKLDSISAAVTGLSDQLGTILATLQTATSTLNASVVRLSASVGEISAAVSTIKDAILPALGALATKDDVSAAVDTLSATLAEISDGVASVSDMVSKVSEDVSAVKSATANVATKADIEAVKADLGAKVDAVMPVLYVAVVLALLAFIFALLSYTAARRK